MPNYKMYSTTVITLNSQVGEATCTKSKNLTFSKVIDNRPFYYTFYSKRYGTPHKIDKVKNLS